MIPPIAGKCLFPGRLTGNEGRGKCPKICIAEGRVMKITIKQVSSLKKIRSAADLMCEEIHRKTALAGERVSYQISVTGDTFADLEISAEDGRAKLYCVKDAVMDMPVTRTDLDRSEEDYLSYEPGLMPDILLPLREQRGRISVTADGRPSVVWVRVDVPEDAAPGIYPVRITFSEAAADPTAAPFRFTAVMDIEVIPTVLPAQKLVYTRWFHTDCIADHHKAEVYSERHWELIEKYIAAAADSGINMILVPVHTPPLDTAVGHRRTCVQLVEIEKKGDRYEFNFDRFHRFISICKKYGITHYEIAHMFSQWGAKCAPNIMVTENGVKRWFFGWDTAADSELYINFLKQYIAAISEQLEAEGINERTYFHISDEPVTETMETYRKASGLIRPLLKGSRTLDALSDYEFYEQGLVECPVTAADRIGPFLEHDVPDQWLYYCISQQKQVTNCFLANPSCRTRIAGFQMYRYHIKGFLHWGFNYYNARLSLYPVDPYLTTSGNGAYPSGDGFNVYPGQDAVYPSIRSEVFYDALQDIRICEALEARIGRKAVEKMIDDAAGYQITFTRYPRNDRFPEDLRAAMTEKIRELSGK